MGRHFEIFEPEAMKMRNDPQMCFYIFYVFQHAHPSAHITTPW